MNIFFFFICAATSETNENNQGTNAITNEESKMSESKFHTLFSFPPKYTFITTW